MLDSGKVDAVYISLPNHLHAEWTIRALQAGVHVLCEKPFAITLDEVDRMIAASRQSGRVLAEAFMYRHHPQTKIVGDWVRSGRLGEITQVWGVFNFQIERQGRCAHDPRIRRRLPVGCGRVSHVVYAICLWRPAGRSHWHAVDRRHRRG